MRKLRFFMMVSLDGYFEGPNHEIDWHNVDEEFNEFAEDMLNSVDVLLFGRVTYKGMASYWPTPEATTGDPIIAEKMNALSKIVFSTTLEEADWNNTRLVQGDAAKEIAELKQQLGKDLIILGSSDLAVSLSGLIDEYWIMVNPVAIGEGKPLFSGIADRLSLRLLRTTTFSSGNVLLCYGPAAVSGGSG